MARRAEYPERGLFSSREAAVSKARTESIYSFYPIGITHESGRPGKTGSGKDPCSAVVIEAGDVPTIGVNPPRGFGTDSRPVRSTLAALGSLRTATYAIGPMTRLGVRSKADGEKLNHERGVRPLAVNTSRDGVEPR